MSQGKVLVIGDDTRGFLAIVRSLGRKRIIVDVAPQDFHSVALFSRYIRLIRKLPVWSGDGSDWLTAIENLLAAESYDLVIPCDERSLLPLHRYRARLSRLSRLAIPDDVGVATFFDKHATREVATLVGVTVPQGRLLSKSDSASSLLREFGLPLVVKHRRSFTLDDLQIRSKVSIVRDEADLVQTLKVIKSSQCLLERYAPGKGVGVSILASNGNILQSFEHHRVRERSGASFYRISALLTPALANACFKIVQEISYTGVAMFEFKVSDDGDWVLLEVNARPWGSLPLPVALGVDFPYRWYRLLVYGEETPAISYRPGVFGRNLLPDLQASLAEMQDLGQGPVRSVYFMMRRLLELLRALSDREIHDVLMRDDLRPGIEEMQRSAMKMAEYTKRMFPKL